MRLSLVSIPVDAADIVKGYEIDKDVSVALEPQEIEALKLETTHTIDLTQFIDASEIDARDFEKPCYVVPADKHAIEGYVVIRQALSAMRKLGIGQVALSGREHIARKSAPFAPERFHESYAEALRTLLAQKARGQRVVMPPTPMAPEVKVVDLLDALRKSLKPGNGAPAAAPKRGRAARKRSS